MNHFGLQEAGLLAVRPEKERASCRLGRPKRKITEVKSTIKIRIGAFRRSEKVRKSAHVPLRLMKTRPEKNRWKKNAAKHDWIQGKTAGHAN